MELVVFAVVLAGVVLVVGREVVQSASGGRGATVTWSFLAGALLAGCMLVASFVVAAEREDAPKAPPGGAKIKPAVKKLVKPKNWPENHPLPIVGSNCAACHLTAGRELTDAVIDFARSAHDLQEMTCYDCHGGHSADDVKAHEEAFGFIGTKKSAHIEGCSACHTEPAEELAEGPHHWDFSQRINTEYPMCFDCHGNHDIGNPPADFKLAAMCGDCHDKPEAEFPNLASVVKANDQLWEVMGKMRRKRVDEPSPVPEAFAKEVSRLRHATMHAVHKSREITAEKAESLNKRAAALRTGLEKWLQSNP